MAHPLDPIRAAAMKYPGAERAFLFGDHEVYRVNKKVYVWVGDEDDGGVYVSVKLKETQDAALLLPFVEPASYGMAKWGWIGATFPKGKPLPLKLLLDWLDESYRYTAPKKLLKQLEASRAGASGSAPRPAQPARKKKPAQRGRAGAR